MQSQQKVSVLNTKMWAKSLQIRFCTSTIQYLKTFKKVKWAYYKFFFYNLFTEQGTMYKEIKANLWKLWSTDFNLYWAEFFLTFFQTKMNIYSISIPLQLEAF